MKSAIAYALVLAIASQATAPRVARAEDPAESLQNLKVLGKGIESRKTHERLQLACVGKPVAEGSLERGCDQLQFVVGDLSGKARRVGPLFALKEGAGRFKKQFKKQLLKAGVNKKPTQEDTNILSGAIQKEKPWAMILMFVAGGTVFFATGGAVGWTLAAFASPSFLDAIFRPVTRMLISKQGGALADATNIKMLNDRSQIGWQLKPKAVKHKHFVKALTALNGGRAPDERLECSMDFSPKSVRTSFGDRMTEEECRFHCREYGKTQLTGDQTATCNWGWKKGRGPIFLETVTAATGAAVTEVDVLEDEEDARLIEALNPEAALDAIDAAADEGELE